MQSVIVLALLVASTQAFLFGPGGLGGLFGAPAGGCDPCAAARAQPYYPPQPAYQPAPAYQQAPAYHQPQAYQQPAPAYQTAPAYNPEPAPAPAPVQQYQTVVAEPAPVAASSGYVQPPPPPPPAAYATGPAPSGYKMF